MFNVSKKTLSLVLCLTLIASVVVFCFAGPASAVTTVKYPTYDSVTSLAAKPIVNLTFDGENRYGIPLHRGTGISYATKGFVTSNTSGGWFFVGKSGEAIKDANGAVIAAGTVEKGKANSDHVAANYLYELEAGTEYRFVMDYKYLKGSTVATINLGIEVLQNPNGSMTNVTGSKTVSGNAVVWNVNGVAQEVGATLTSDTDIQTMIATIVPKENGYLGLQNHSTASATIAIDSIKLYRLDSFNSSCQNPITFDNGGIVSTRAVNNDKASYHQDGYAIIPDTSGCAGAAFIGIDNIYNKSADIGHNKSNIAEADSLYHSKMFKFLPGHSYKITFRYRYAAGSYVINGAIPRLKLQMAPNGAAKGYDDLWNKYGIPKEGSFAKDVFVTGLECVTANAEKTTAIAEDTPWQDVTITFTVRDDITSIQGYEDFTGAYFGIGVGQSGDNHGMTGVTANRTLHIDDYNVEELVGYQLSSFDSQNVSLDFENDATTSSLGVSIYEKDKNNSASIEKDTDTGSNYLKISSYGGRARVSMTETGVLKAGKKYYISFSAKTENEGADFHLTMGKKGEESGGFRIFFTDTATQNALTASGSKFYINGEDVNGYANFKPTADWQNFGFTLNLDLSIWDNAGSPDKVNSAGWIELENKGGAYLLFGAYINGVPCSVCYDNIKISQFDEIPNAVPATDGQVYRDTYTYSNDFDSITTTNLTQNTADKASVEADASAPERGNIIKILSGGSRLTVNDTNVFEAGYKYTISFDAKLDPDSATDTSRMYAIFAPINSLHSPRYFIMDTGSGCTNPDVLGAFKFYIGGQESTWKDFAIDKNWKTYTIEFDYTNESFLAAASSESTNTDTKAQMKGLSNAVSYFHFGCANGWFDNLKIVKTSYGEIKDYTQVSKRNPSGSGENYISAGLRFKNCLPNDVVAAADEVGFVVIPSTMAVTAPTTWYKLDGTGSASAQTVVCKNATMNQMYERTASETYYQLVLTGLSTESGKTAYNRRFSAVMYTKKDGAYTYYALGETSFNQVGAIADFFNAQ